MKPRTIAASLLLLALLLTAATTVHAQKPEVRRITQTYATSDCIGDAGEPKCALETVLACWVRWSSDLCNLVGIDLQTFQGRFDPHVIFEYQILDMATAWLDDHAAPSLVFGEHYTTGVVNIDADLRVFRHGKWLWNGMAKHIFVFKPVADRWHLIYSEMYDTDYFPAEAFPYCVENCGENIERPPANP